MPDQLEHRCSILAGPVVSLMQQCLEAQGNPAALVGVTALVERIRGVIDLGVDGIDSASYRSWAASAPPILDAIALAADAGDARAAWTAFTDQTAGFHRLGEACAGQAGW